MANICHMRTSRPLALILLLWLLLPLPGKAGPLPQPDPRDQFVTSQTRSIDWEQAARESTAWLARYLAIDTTNPPGHELEAARFFDEIFRGHGLTGTIDEYAPGRANFMVRLKGNGTLPPLILTSHSDVVPADPALWKVPPFSGEVRDGYIWGRGALDMKDVGIVQMMTVLLLARHRVPLARDVIFLVLADEEADSSGAERVLKAHPEWVKGAEFLLNEGESIQMSQGKPLYYGVAVMEKSPLWLRLIARGTPGHASIPDRASATNRLVRALARLQAWEQPVILAPPVKRYFADLARYQTPARARSFAHLESALRDPNFRGWILSQPEYNAVLRNTVSLTELAAGESVNVIPARAEAALDCRLLPGQPPSRFLAELKKHLKDPSIEVKVIFSYESLASPVNTELFAAITRAAARHDPGIPVTTPPLLSSTDSHYFRTLGITSYGFEPFRLTEADDATCHGNDERISLANLDFGNRLLFEIVCDLAGDYPGRTTRQEPGRAKRNQLLPK